MLVKSLTFVAGLIATKLGSPMYMLMNIKAHLELITNQSEKNSHAQWITSSECKVSTSSPYCCHGWLADMGCSQSILQDRLGMVLMSPSLTAYVTGLSDKVIVSYVTTTFLFIESLTVHRSWFKSNPRSLRFRQSSTRMRVSQRSSRL